MAFEDESRGKPNPDFIVVRNTPAGRSFIYDWWDIFFGTRQMWTNFILYVRIQLFTHTVPCDRPGNGPILTMGPDSVLPKGVKGPAKDYYCGVALVAHIFHTCGRQIYGTRDESQPNEVYNTWITKMGEQRRATARGIPRPDRILGFFFFSATIG